jgi:hypothetical protein
VTAVTRTLLVSLAVVLAARLPAADPPTPTPPVAEPQYEAKFLDGSVVMLTAGDAEVVVATKYGKLTVPLAAVKKLDIGFRYPAGVEAKVKAAVEELGSPDYTTREDAQRRLLGFGEYAVPAVKAGLKHPTPEVVERCGQILKGLTQRLPADQLDPRLVDVITTDESVIRGTIETPALKVKSKYFGEASIKLVDLRELRPVGGQGGGMFTLSAAKHASQGWGNWFDTGVEVAKDRPVEVTITGQIDQWSQEPGRYVAGPNGTQAMVAGPGMGQAELLRAQKLGGLQPGGPGMPGGGMAYQSGAVYGRIGPNGPIFKVGSSYKQASATAGGKLYLIIAPSNWGNESTGEYKVTVKTGGG